MASVYSFKEYVARNFNDQFWQVAEQFICDHEDNLDSLGVDLRRVHRAGELEITEVDVEHVWAYERPRMKIGFDVALSVSFTVSERDYQLRRL